MRESISITYILQIVILFILLFTAIMALTINNSNAFGMKDEVINIIEMNKGKYYKTADKDELLDDITKAFQEASYRTSGKCDYDNDFKGYTRDGKSTTSNDAAVCIKEIDATSSLESYLEGIFGSSLAKGDSMDGKYYQVEVFYQLEIPIISQAYNFSSKGETKIIYEK